VIESRAVIDKALAGGLPIYGVTTGFGKLSDVRIQQDEIRQLQINLLRTRRRSTVSRRPPTKKIMSAWE